MVGLRPGTETGRGITARGQLGDEEAAVILWWIANIVGLVVVIPLVVVLANRVIRYALESRRYGDDILVHGVRLAGNLDPVPALVETRDRVADVTANAVRYVTALDRVVSS